MTYSSMVRPDCFAGQAKLVNGSGAPLGSVLLPLGTGRVPAPFDGFHRAVVPEVLSGEDG